MTARTPNPYAGPRQHPHVDLDSYDQRADEPISQWVQGRPLTLQNAQEAREAYEDCRAVALSLRAENARLRYHLKLIGDCLQEHLSQQAHDERLESTDHLCPCQGDLNVARAALAGKDGE